MVPTHTPDPEVGELYLFKDDYSPLGMSNGDLILLVHLEPEEEAPAAWKRDVTVLVNGRTVKWTMTEFKSMVRWKYIENVHKNCQPVVPEIQ